MSMRNFERKFREQVGTCPKLFCRTLRFNRALKLKLRAPGKCWTNIALECDYYDQMHMIRDFKKFGGMSPTKLFLKINMSKAWKLFGIVHILPGCSLSCIDLSTAFVLAQK